MDVWTYVMLAPVAIYFLVYVGSSAYFKSKRDHIKRILTHDDNPPSDKTREP